MNTDIEGSGDRTSDGHEAQGNSSGKETAAGSGTPNVSFVKAYLDWQHATAEARLHYQRQWREVVAERMATRQELYLESSRKLQSAYARMVTAWQFASVDDASRAAYQEATRAYMQAQSELWSSERFQQFRDITARFAKAQQAALDEVQRRLSETGKAYVSALQEAWAGMKPEAMDSSTLFTAASAIASAACSVRLTSSDTRQ